MDSKPPARVGDVGGEVAKEVRLGDLLVGTDQASGSDGLVRARDGEPHNPQEPATDPLEDNAPRCSEPQIKTSTEAQVEGSGRAEADLLEGGGPTLGAGEELEGKAPAGQERS